MLKSHVSRGGHTSPPGHGQASYFEAGEVNSEAAEVAGEATATMAVPVAFERVIYNVLNMLNKLEQTMFFFGGVGVRLCIISFKDGD